MTTLKQAASELVGWFDQKCPRCGGSGEWVMTHIKDPYEMRSITEEAVVTTRMKCPDCWGKGTQFLPSPSPGANHDRQTMPKHPRPRRDEVHPRSWTRREMLE